MNELAEKFHDNALTPPNRRLSQDILDRTATKVLGFITDHLNRTWIGLQWHVLSRGQFHPRVVIRPRHLIDEPLSLALRTTSLRTLVPKLHAASADPAFIEYQDDKLQFVGMCEAFATFMKSRNPEAIREFRSNPTAVIREPTLLTDWIKNANKRYSDPMWDQSLRCFPDRLPQTRWARLVAWYAWTHALAPEQSKKALGNCYDDADYAFMSSFTGHLVSQDTGLIKCVRAIFPYVSIWNPLEDDWTKPRFV